jgi:hypothetical protein
MSSRSLLEIERRPAGPTDCSPWREPWDRVQGRTASPGGAAESFREWILLQRRILSPTPGLGNFSKCNVTTLPSHTCWSFRKAFMQSQTADSERTPVFNANRVAESKPIAAFYVTLNFLFSVSLAARNYYLRRPRSAHHTDVRWLCEVFLVALTVSLAPLSVAVAKRQSNAVASSPEHREAIFWTTLRAVNYFLFIAYLLILWL